MSDTARSTKPLKATCRFCSRERWFDDVPVETIVVPPSCSTCGKKVWVDMLGFEIIFGRY